MTVRHFLLKLNVWLEFLLRNKRLARVSTPPYSFGSSFNASIFIWFGFLIKIIQICGTLENQHLKIATVRDFLFILSVSFEFLSKISVWFEFRRLHMHLALVFVDKWPQVPRRPRRLAPPMAYMAASAAQATRINFPRCPKAPILLQLHRFRPPPAVIGSQKFRFCDSYTDSTGRAPRMGSSSRRLGVMSFRA